MKKAEFENTSCQDAPLPFALREREVRQWVSDLPMTDIQRCCGLVLPTLKVLNRQPMPAIARFETLEELRPLVFLLSQKLESKFIGARFPLEKTAYKSATDCIEFHHELAHGYALVSLDRSFYDQIHFNDITRTHTLHRALQSYAQVMVQQGLLYQTRTFESWREVYALYSLAERELKLDLSSDCHRFQTGLIFSQQHRPSRTDIVNQTGFKKAVEGNAP